MNSCVNSMEHSSVCFYDTLTHYLGLHLVGKIVVIVVVTVGGSFAVIAADVVGGGGGLGV